MIAQVLNSPFLGLFLAAIAGAALLIMLRAGVAISTRILAGSILAASVAVFAYKVDPSLQSDLARSFSASGASVDSASSSTDMEQLLSWYSLVCQQEVLSELCARDNGRTCRARQFEVEKDLSSADAVLSEKFERSYLDNFRARAKRVGSRLVRTWDQTNESVSSLPGNQDFELKLSNANIKDSCDNEAKVVSFQ